jgi:hypothetical protein
MHGMEQMKYSDKHDDSTRKLVKYHWAWIGTVTTIFSSSRVYMFINY